ncbi:sushi, von Willebrand factor type A, EGF and pentraxin domain-containing protein 1-like [Uloborus diversus]|uniref:sushi, von Willebrand factor type A, EGF and pentraxin domain-containing protein 1-like n=1 Tax=Uloborus diversus TaxID=327109 RepID=UPI0024093435|nr:sushi, von Willebrand factor type A, EGF and pentraxin domain-containing protein 1-like [Uloborus diversus]
MPRKYVRNHTVARGQWTEENLILAMAKVKNGEISKNKVSRLYGIPIRTLSRRLKTGDTKKTGLGPQAEASPDQSLCRDPGYIKNGDRMSTHPITSRQHQRGFRLGTQMTYYCVEGYQLRGTDSIYCTSGGKWTAKRPLCESTPKSDVESYCDNPGPLANGQVVMSPSQGSRQPAITDEGFRQGTRLQFYCDPGHNMIGHDSATCGSDGMWSTSFPYCEKDEDENEIFCRDPGTISNGRVSVFTPKGKEGRLSDKYTQGTILEYECQSGYQITGSFSISCESNGFWSGVTPSCVEETQTEKERCGLRNNVYTRAAESNWFWGNIV